MARLIVDGTAFKLPTENPSNRAMPKVSFILPTYNNEETIESCLQSIRNQRYGNIEIVVVDKMSRDHTVEIARKYADKVVSDAGTYGSACQTGLENSTGEVVITWDDDITIPDRDWLEKSLHYFHLSSKVSSLIPLNVSPLGAPPLCKMYFGFWRAVVKRRIRKVVGLVPARIHLRKCVEEVGGFERRLHWGPDTLLSKKLYEAGYLHVYYEEPIEHRTMATFKEYVRKQIYGSRSFNVVMEQGGSIGYVLYEHTIIGVREAIIGLGKNQKEWLLFPLFFVIRIIAYGVRLAMRSLNLS